MLCFRNIAKWINYEYTYIHSIFRFFPIQAIRELLCYAVGPY